MLADGILNSKMILGAKRSLFSDPITYYISENLLQVTFSSPAIRGGSDHDRQPPSSKVTRLPIPKHTPFSKSSPTQHGSVEKVLQGQSKSKCESVKSEGVRSEGVRSEGVGSEGVMDVESEEMLAQRQEEMEQAAMAGLSECVCVCVIMCVSVFV